MDNKQIAHDLAVAKLYGVSLSTDKLIEQYRQYYKEIYECLESNEKPKPTKVIKSPY